MLELASELTSDFSVLIVDDGSTDDTYETAGDLAARYPQISVMRLAVRRGVGRGNDAISQRGTADAAGISTLNDAMTTAHQRISGFQVIASLLREGGTDGTVPLERTDTSAADSQTPTPHVGTIPPLPTPKVRDVITHFALGE